MHQDTLRLNDRILEFSKSVYEIYENEEMLERCFVAFRRIRKINWSKVKNLI